MSYNVRNGWLINKPVIGCFNNFKRPFQKNKNIL